MSVAKSLDTLREDMPGCALAAFGDLRTRLILRASSREGWAQEELDKIAAQAVRSFAMSDAVHAPGTHDDALDVIVLTPDDTRVICRSRANEADFLCCICDDRTTPLKIIAKVRGQLDQLDGGA